MDRRTEARELAMQGLYQLDIHGDDSVGEMEGFLQANSIDGAVFELARQWMKGTWENLEICDKLISEAAIKWQLEHLSQVDKSILRLSVYQLEFCPDVPGKVVINEAIDIAKKYSSAQSGRFINGVLDAILKKVS